MRSIEFSAWCSFGKNDNEETIVIFDLTEEEIERLQEAAEEWYWDDFSDCEEVNDIYEKVLEAAVDQITEEMKENQPGFREMLGEGRKADSIYYIGVAWPEEMEPGESEEED